MTLNWNTVTQEHVTRACKLVASGEVKPRKMAKGIFLLEAGEKLPAKHVLSIAYCLANDMALDSKIKFSSGEGMANRLRKLGFDVEHVKLNKVST